jgi:hypothetical protein
MKNYFLGLLYTRLTQEIYEADVGGNAGKGTPRQTFLDQIGEVLKKGKDERV